MIGFDHLKIYNWLDALRGMRNSYKSWDEQDSYEIKDNVFVMGDKDYELAMKLSKAGSDHAKYLRQILVSIDIIAPEYFWKEFDTYKIGTVANSTSMMHTLGNKPLTADMFSFDEVDNDVVEYLDLINKVRCEWIIAGKIKHSRCPEWRKMNQLMSIAYNYRRTVTMNYAVLQSIYRSRKNHRLSEWVDMSIWIECLPYSNLITQKERF